MPTVPQSVMMGQLYSILIEERLNHVARKWRNKLKPSIYGRSFSVLIGPIARRSDLSNTL